MSIKGVRMVRHRLWLEVGCALALALGMQGIAVAAEGPSGAAAPRDEPESVLVTAARSETSALDLPVSVDRIDGARIREGNLQVNLSEALAGVAGVSAQQRQNYAQDLQVSVRGFGARSSFGVRGVRLYTDGIPATMPDGQGQFSHFDLGSAGHLEVLRGPFSVLYGNSSGGVIALYTEEPKVGTAVQALADVGSFETRRYGLKGSVASEAASLLVDVGRFSTGGTREHSAAERTTFNARAHWQLGTRSSLTLIGNAVDLPEAQDPLGLTRAQLTLDPHQAGTGAVSFNTRKSVSQQQLGADYELEFAEHARLSLMAYGGGRDTRQYQSIPVATQAPPTHPGGVIDLHRNYRGLDAHASNRYALGAGSLELVAGAAFDSLDEARRGYLNYVGTALGVEGALRRADANRVYDLDEYVQAQWDSGGRWLALAGARHSLVDVRSLNELLAPGASNPSKVRYQATNPVAGLTFRLAPRLRLYGSFGRGFETPTLNDLAYRSTNGSLPGLNLALVPAESNHYEIGFKAESGPLRATLAAFRIDTRNELAVIQNSGGRSVFGNIPLTERRGAELELQGEWSRYLGSRFSYTWTHAVTGADYMTCTAVPCAAANVPVPSGSWIAAVPEHAVGAAVTARAPAIGLGVTLEAQLRSSIYVNDLNTDAASGSSIVNLHLDLAQQHRGWRYAESLRVDNLFDRSYVGSVIVNESNARYFEPEPGRSVYLMLQVSRAPAP
jgi:iron complex outermembrane receptor protein